MVLVAVALGSLTASASAGRKPRGDISPPTVVINQSQDQVDPTLNAPLSFTATFSEAVTGFSGSDVAIGGTSAGTKAVGVSSSDGKTFTVSVTGMSGTGGNVTAMIPAGAAQDAAGNWNLPSTSVDNSVTYADPGQLTNQATYRVDLTARFGSNLAQAMTWLAANPQPAIVTAGVYTTKGVLDIPAGADLIFVDATTIPTNPGASSIRLRGAGTKLTFAGISRIGAVGARNSRLGNAEAAGIELERASGFTITADDLTIEGVAQVGLFSYRGSHDGVVAGKITAINTGADSFHVTDGSYNLDFRATLLSVGSGDDGFAVVSYLSNLVRVRNIHWHDITVMNQRWGRGISVVGGENITVDHGSAVPAARATGLRRQRLPDGARVLSFLPDALACIQ